jgi:hypothetical protein
LAFYYLTALTLIIRRYSNLATSTKSRAEKMHKNGSANGQQTGKKLSKADTRTIRRLMSTFLFTFLVFLGATGCCLTLLICGNKIASDRILGIILELFMLPFWFPALLFFIFLITYQEDRARRGKDDTVPSCWRRIFSCGKKGRRSSLERPSQATSRPPANVYSHPSDNPSVVRAGVIDDPIRTYDSARNMDIEQYYPDLTMHSFGFDRQTVRDDSLYAPRE